MRLLVPLGLQPTTLEGDDTVRLSCGEDPSGLRGALEAQLADKTLRAKDLCAGRLLSHLLQCSHL